MSYWKTLAIALTTFACAAALSVNAGAQTRGRSAGGSAPAVGRSVPRAPGPRGGSPGVIVGAPLRPYYPYYYGFRPGFSIGFGFGYPYYYGYYGYPYYGAYGYGYYPPGYPPYGYPPYGYGGYVVPRGYAAGYGGIRIQGAPPNAEVYVDGAYAGVVDQYSGVFQSLDLAPGPHEIEIRTSGRPLTYDVNVTPGQTLTVHANVR